MIRFIYICLSYLLSPFVLIFLFWRGIKNRAYWEGLPERYGLTIPQHDDKCIWVHAVSVGEVQAASALIERLLQRSPKLALVVTTVTPTGATRVKEIFGDRVSHYFAPYDLPGSVARFFDRINPSVLIVIETELWPTLYHECGKRKVPLILASARISPPSVGKYRRFISLFREALSHGIVIAAQSESDAERFRELGANPARTHTTGNIKFDFELSDLVYEQGAIAKQQHAADRPVLLAASTHENEEEMVIEAMHSIWKRHPNCLLIVAPRHPERFSSVASLLKEKGLVSVRRTSGKSCSNVTQVLLVDTLGELRNYYVACDVAFVGGSLVPIGGHNLLEPAALGKPIVTGPYLYNTEDIAKKLSTAGALKTVTSAATLASVSIQFLDDEQSSQVAGTAGKKVVEENRGALDRLLKLIDPLL